MIGSMMRDDFMNPISAKSISEMTAEACQLAWKCAKPVGY